MKQSVLTGSLGFIGDRFTMEGYKDNISFEEKVKGLADIEGLQGIEVSNYGEESDGLMVGRILADYGLECACVDLFIGNRRVYRYGSLGNRDPKVRILAVDECMRAADYAQELGAGVINVWPGQDGFDYPFTCDYGRMYDDFLESTVKIADHNPDIRVALEFKSREPRNRSLVDSVGTALLMSMESGRENVGVCVDTEHVLSANGSIANTIEMCARRGKLFHVHTNDCLNTWFDGMSVGSVHFTEFLEFVYMLRKVDYDGWCSLDLFPCREDAIAVTRESVAYMQIYDAIIEKIGMEAIGDMIEKGDYMQVSQMIRTCVFDGLR